MNQRGIKQGCYQDKMKHSFILEQLVTGSIFLKRIIEKGGGVALEQRDMRLPVPKYNLESTSL
jgi:hypothetical protein